MSRLRKSLAKIDNFAQNDYLEPNEQDDLIALLNDVSYERNQVYLRVFLVIFLVLTPFYIILPFFKQKPLYGFFALLAMLLNCICLHYLNHYSLTKQLIEQKADSQAQGNANIDDMFTIASRNDTIVKIQNFILKAQRSFANEPKYLVLFHAMHVSISILLIRCHYQVDPTKVKFKNSIDTRLFIIMPSIASATNIIVNQWVTSTAAEIEGLKKYKYHEKSV